MANMTSQTDEQRRADESSRDDQSDPSTMARVAAGASTLTNQQLRKARASFDEQISSQRERVTGRVRTLGRALKGAGEMLEEDDLVAQCLHYASDKVNGVAGYVEELEPTRAAEDLRDLARDRPALFFGGAFALGLALGRFARSSAEVVAGSTSAGKPRQASRTAGVSRGAAPSSRAAASYRPPTPGTTTPSSGSTQAGSPTRTGALRP